ncbi:MAG: RNA polymerase sigma-70 factor [Bacteroidales bacterium]|nr:RNA polymerase sigma-70 factor [Bacteroidales bacterium]
MIDYRDFYARYFKRAYLYVKSYVHDTTAAEDLTAEAMIQVWRKLDPGREDRALPFLFTILHNQCINYLEREKRRRAAAAPDSWEIDELEQRLSDLNRTTEEDIFSQEITSIFQETVRLMPERTREIFLLHRAEKKSYAEIALRFDISEKGVEYHISRALKLLRTALKDYLG